MSLGEYQKQARLMGILYGFIVGMEASGEPITYAVIEQEMKKYCTREELANVCQTLAHFNEVVEKLKEG